MVTEHAEENITPACMRLTEPVPATLSQTHDRGWFLFRAEDQSK